jgi:hypothetical protein
MSQDDLKRALFGFDDAFERTLAEAILTAIVDTSYIDDESDHLVLALRLGETAQALTTALALVLALSPASSHDTHAIKQTSRSFRRKLSAGVQHARRDPDLHEFLRRSFNSSDRARGGRG